MIIVPDASWVFKFYFIRFISEINITLFCAPRRCVQLIQTIIIVENALLSRLY